MVDNKLDKQIQVLKQQLFASAVPVNRYTGIKTFNKNHNHICHGITVKATEYQ